MSLESIPTDYSYFPKQVPGTLHLLARQKFGGEYAGVATNTFRTWSGDSLSLSKVTGVTMENCFLWNSCDDNPPKSLKEEIADELNSYLYLEYGWDGIEGIPASKKAIENAIALLKSMPDEFPLPKPMIAGDGEVGFYWNEGDAFIDLEFSDNAIVNYYIRGADGREFFGENQPLGSSIPADIFNCLKEIK